MSFKFQVDVENSKILNINLIINTRYFPMVIDDELKYKLENILSDNIKILSIRDLKGANRKADCKAPKFQTESKSKKC